MAKFSIYLISENSNIILTDFNSYNIKENFATTFDESVVFDVHSANKLSFSMAKFILDNGQKIENPLAFQIVHGSKIRLIDKNLLTFDFIVQKIDYDIRKDNIMITFDCQSSFTYELTKRNLGYTITDDIENDSFVGALKLDEWAAKIKEECNIDWNYVNVDVRNYNILAFDSEQTTFNESRSFSVSNSNAYNALVELAKNYGMLVDVNYSNKTFSFIPEKSPIFKGVYMNPLNNLQSLSVSTDSQSMATILSVTGAEDIDGNEITLIPNIPAQIVDWFGTEEWEDTLYSTTLYSDKVQQIMNSLSRDPNEEEINFLDQINYTPWLENRLINFEYFQNTYFLSPNKYNALYDDIYNKLRIINGKLIYQTNAYLINQRETDQKLSFFQNSLVSNLNAAWEYGMTEYLKALESSGTANAANTYFTRFQNSAAEVSNFILTSVVEKSKLIDNYEKLYNSYRQKFLKNLFLFQQYWYADYESTYIGQYYATKTIQVSPALTDSEIIKLAEIKQKLTQYWNAAVSAGKLSNYWIPPSWDSVVKLQTINTPQKTRWMAIIKDVSNYVINEDFIPIDIVFNPLNIGEEYSSNDVDSLCSYDFISGLLSVSGVILGIYYRIYRLLVPFIGSGPEDIDISEYLSIKNEKNHFWLELYNKYPALLLEAKYEDSTSTTAELLYKAAYNAFKNMITPEPSYSVTALDIRNSQNINLFGLELGDQIRILDEVIQEKPDQLKKLLQQELFISSINYTLRSDSDIKLTVNSIRYDDKLLSRLVKLIT